MNNRLLVATHNPGKVTELSEMLRDLGVRFVSLAEVGIVEDVEETGDSIFDNAVLKAKQYAIKTGLLTLADDSGLEVDALDGKPGVHTARYGGEGLSQRQRYQLLLRTLQGVPWEKRTARFRAVIALASADGVILGTTEGVCEGIIAEEPMGNGGFGYDPVFYLPEWGKTMAQLESAEKSEVSHRGRALRAMVPILRHVLSTPTKGGFNYP